MAPALRAEAMIRLTFQTAVIEPIARLLGTSVRKVLAIIILTVALTASFPLLFDDTAPSLLYWSRVALWFTGLALVIGLFIWFVESLWFGND